MRSAIPDEMDNLLRELEEAAPIVFSRAEAPRIFGGMISYSRLANLDSEGQGPPRVMLGRRVGYPRRPFFAWWRERLQKQCVAKAMGEAR